MRAPIYLLHVMVTVTLLVLGILLIIEGIDEGIGPSNRGRRQQR